MTTIFGGVNPFPLLTSGGAGGVADTGPVQDTTPTAPTQSTAGSTSSTSSSTAANSATGQAQVNASNILIANANLASGGSTGALLAGGSTVSVLGSSLDDDATSIFGSLPSQSNFLFQKMLATAAQRFSKLQNQVTDTADLQIAGITAQQNKWITAQSNIDNAQVGVTDAQKSIADVSDLLLDIRGYVSLAGQSGQDVKLNATDFDNTINEINSQAESAPSTMNLVGNISPVDYAPNQVQYDNNPNMNQTTLTGSYISTDYRIMANDGSVWVADPSTNSVTKYSALQGEAQTVQDQGLTLDDTASGSTGLKLVSYNPQTNAITMNVTIDPDQPPQVVTGTLQRTGLGLMPSWFYDGLTTASGRQRAFSDINAAEVNLTSAGATVAGAGNQVQTDLNASNAALNQLTQQTVAVKNTEVTQETALQKQSVNQLTALQTNLQSLQSQQSNYYDLLADSVDDSVSQSLLDLTI